MGFGVWGFGLGVSVSLFRDWGSGFGVYGLGCGVESLGFRVYVVVSVVASRYAFVSTTWFRVSGLGCEVQGLGFRV